MLPIILRFFVPHAFCMEKIKPSSLFWSLEGTFLIAADMTCNSTTIIEAKFEANLITGSQAFECAIFEIGIMEIDVIILNIIDGIRLNEAITFIEFDAADRAIEL